MDRMRQRAVMVRPTGFERMTEKSGSAMLSGDPPFLFLLGSGRSGTTLLVAMLDSHPDLAIPAETGGFILQLCDDPPLSDTGDLDIDVFLGRLQQNERFRLWELDGVALRQNLEEAAPKTVPQALRAVYRSYAANYGKSRYGDKTPNHVLRIPVLASFFPESRFVHIIRDGRDVALALRDVPFGPDTPEERAEYWVTCSLPDDRRGGNWARAVTSRCATRSSSSTLPRCSSASFILSTCRTARPCWISGRPRNANCG